MKKEKNYTQLINKILNDDYSDFEKASMLRQVATNWVCECKDKHDDYYDKNVFAKLDEGKTKN